MQLKTRLREHFPNRERVELILQRRLDALEQMFSEPPAVKVQDFPFAAGEASQGKEKVEAIDEEEFVVWLFGRKYHVRRLR
jgi:hypothetical protein